MDIESTAPPQTTSEPHDAAAPFTTPPALAPFDRGISFAETLTEFIHAAHGPVPENLFTEVRTLPEPRPDDDDPDPPRPISVYHSSPAAAAAWIVARAPALHAAGFAVYYGVAPRSKRHERSHHAGRDRDVPVVGALWADLDFKLYSNGNGEGHDTPEAAARAQLAAFPMQPSAIVHSGNGLHAYFTLNAPIASADAAELNARIAAALHSDPSVVNPSRILRVPLPGLTNRKDPTTPKPIVLEYLNPSETHSRSDFDALTPSASSASSPRHDSASNQHARQSPSTYISPAKAAPGEDRGAITALSRAAARLISSSSGDRNNALNRAAFFAGHFVGAGRIDRAQVEATLGAAAAAIGLPPSEITSVLRHSIDDGAREPLYSGIDPTSGGTAAVSTTAIVTAGTATSPTTPATTQAATAPSIYRPALDRGDEVELATILLARLRAPDAPLKFDAGDLYQYRPDTGLWSAIPADRKSSIIQSLAGSPIYAGEDRNGQEKTKPLKISARAVGGSISLAHDQATHTDFFHDAPPGIVFTNGFLSVSPIEATLNPHSPDHRARFSLPIAYDPDVDPVAFYAFLADVLGTDDSAIACIQLLQEHAGITLLGLAPRYSVAIVLTGSGHNGKSTYLEILSSLFPPTSIAAVAPQDWHDQFALSHLVGKRLNIVSELPEASIISSEVVKNVISGDLKSVRPPYGKPFNFRPEAGHVFACNRLPGTDDLTPAFWRRFTIVPFERVVPKDRRITDLAQKLIAAEHGAIAAWAIRGAQRVLASHHFTVPDSSTRAMADWKLNADPIAQWAAENTHPVTDPRIFTQSSILFEDFKTWATSTCHRHMSTTKFGMRMKQLGILQFRGKNAGDWGTHYGLALGRRNEGDESE